MKGDYNTTYNGYYYYGSVNSQNPESILYLIKGKNAQVGDYLLIMDQDNDDNVVLRKLTSIEDSIYNFTTINIDEFIFYAVKMISESSFDEKILYVNILSDPKIIIAENYNDGIFDKTKTRFDGDISQPSENETLYLNISETSDTTILKLNYIDVNTFIPVITGLSQFQFIVEGTPYNDKYISLIKLNSQQSEVTQINFDSPYQGYYKDYMIYTDSGSIINTIKELKENREVIKGDMLLFKNKNKVRLFFV